jgi:hypothetical protein
MTAMTALVAVLRDIAEGRYDPPIAVVDGLGEALDLLAAHRAAEVAS